MVENQDSLPSAEPEGTESEEEEGRRATEPTSAGRTAPITPAHGSLEIGGEAQKLHVEESRDVVPPHLPYTQTKERVLPFKSKSVNVSAQILNQEQEINLNTSTVRPMDNTSTWALGSSIVGVGSKFNWNSWRQHYKWSTLHFTHLPGWMRDNAYVHNYYRPQLKSYMLCFLSIFRLHYDSVNIWTHLLGILMLIGLMVWCLLSLKATAFDLGMLSIFFCTAIICFFNSASFHIFWVRSPKVSRLLNRLDYVSIVILILGSFVSWLYYLLYCYVILQVVYLSILSLLGIATFIIFTFERFTRPRYRWFRAVAFVGLGLSGLLPIIHSLYLTGLYVAYDKLSLGWLLALAASYIAGATIYALRIPEKWWPGKFDIFFHSHQFLHLATLVAVCFYTRGIWLMMNYQINETTCIPSYWI